MSNQMAFETIFNKVADVIPDYAKWKLNNQFLMKDLKVNYYPNNVAGYVRFKLEDEGVVVNCDYTISLRLKNSTRTYYVDFEVNLSTFYNGEEVVTSSTPPYDVWAGLSEMHDLFVEGQTHITPEELKEHIEKILVKVDVRVGITLGRHMDKLYDTDRS